jgi:P27 family predicted phage terminase small subunit
MPGPPPKPPARRQGRGRRDLGVVPDTDNAPKAPSGLCKAARDAWAAYWNDVVAGILRDADDALVERWIKNVDRYQRLISAADAEPIVTGSTGQQRPNPLYDLAFKIEASIKDDEKQLGIGPLNRLKLGVALTESAKSLAELNAEAEVEDDENDPRLNIIKGSSLA